MKRLGMVLLGLMFWSMNTLAQEDCGTPPRVLAPGKHSVLLFDQPFVVQWQDDDQCLGDMVKIEITETGHVDSSSYVLIKETQNSGHYQVRLNYRFTSRHGPGRYRIKISNIHKTFRPAVSKNFTIEDNRWIGDRLKVQMTSVHEDIDIRGLLIRLTAMEKQSRWLIKLLAENDDLNNWLKSRYPEGISEGWDDKDFEETNEDRRFYSWQWMEGGHIIIDLMSNINHMQQLDYVELLWRAQIQERDGIQPDYEMTGYDVCEIKLDACRIFETARQEARQLTDCHDDYEREGWTCEDRELLGEWNVEGTKLGCCHGGWNYCMDEYCNGDQAWDR